MKTYVQVLEKKVINVVSLSDDDMEETLKHEYVGDFVDITKVTPAPHEGWFYDNATQTFATPDLIELRASQSAMIDQTASILRLALMPFRNQSEIYRLKTIEAEKYIANPTPSDLTSYPWIQIDVTVTGLSADDVADNIKNKNDEMISRFQEIELVRRNGKESVRNAVTYDEILVATDDAIQALDIV